MKTTNQKNAIRKMEKSNKGITLIALVVTIVVLLILAGISISMVLGNNGLITKARDAKTQTEQDQQNTEIAMNNLADEIDSILGDSNSGTGGSDDDTIKIGDYVNYTYDTVTDGYPLPTTQSGYHGEQTIVQNSTTLQWRILNIDEDNGTIDLVSATFADDAVYFKGALGYNNGVYLLNDMCRYLYSNSALGITARSINLKDIEAHLTVSGLSARNNYTIDGYKYGDIVTYTENNAYYPNLYAQQNGSGINTTTVKTDGINQSDAYYTTPTTETYSQASDGGLTITYTHYKNITFDETNYGVAGDILCSSDVYEDYWVATRSETCTSKGGYFNIVQARNSVKDGFLWNKSYGDSFDYGYLRPIVTLSIELLDGTKDADGAWNLKS